MMLAPTSSRGLALINALLIVAAMSAVAVLLLQRAEASRVRMAYTQEVIQAKAYLDGFEALLMQQLDADRKRGTADHLQEPWAQKNYTVQIDRGQASGTISDLQSKFNLNWLAGGDAVFGPEAFAALMVAMGQRDSLRQAITEWVSEGGPVDKSPYLNRRVRLAPTGGTAALLDELRLVSGMTPQIFARLEPVLTVLPGEGVINVNTAPRVVLLALMPELPPATINALLAHRRDTPFDSEDSFYAWLQGKLGQEVFENFDLGRFVVSSRWFEARISVTLGQTRLQRRVIFHRAGETGKSRVQYRLTDRM